MVNFKVDRIVCRTLVRSLAGTLLLTIWISKTCVCYWYIEKKGVRESGRVPYYSLYQLPRNCILVRAYLVYFQKLHEAKKGPFIWKRKKNQCGEP